MTIIEAQVQADLMAALMPLQPDLMYWRNNTGGVKTPTGFIKFGLIGSPDIIGVYGGRFIGIEVKSYVGRLRPEQIKFRDRFERAGGLYLLCRGCDDIQRIVDTIRQGDT